MTRRPPPCAALNKRERLTSRLRGKGRDNPNAVFESALSREPRDAPFVCSDEPVHDVTRYIAAKTADNGNAVARRSTIVLGSEKVRSRIETRGININPRESRGGFLMRYVSWSEAGEHYASGDCERRAIYSSVAVKSRLVSRGEGGGGGGLQPAAQRNESRPPDARSHFSWLLHSISPSASYARTKRAFLRLARVYRAYTLAYSPDLYGL